MTFATIHDRVRRLDIPGFLPYVHHTDEEPALLYRLAAAPLGGDIVEIGTLCGRSTAYLAAGLIAAGTGCVYAVDPHTIDDPNADTIRRLFDLSPGCVSTAAIADRNLRDAGVREAIEMLVMRSAEAAGRLPCEPFAKLVFIDGDHSEAGVRADLETWAPRVLPGGAVALHDYGVGAWPDVAAAATAYFGDRDDYRDDGLTGTIRVYDRTG